MHNQACIPSRANIGNRDQRIDNAIISKTGLRKTTVNDCTSGLNLPRICFGLTGAMRHL